MRRRLANWLNERGRAASSAGDRLRTHRYYRWAMAVDRTWSVPWYNLALDAKYRGEWAESLRCNQQAAALNRNDEAAWWNLGIAATALQEWSEARRAWRACGVEIDGNEGEECRMPALTACVRVDPNGSAEVLWGQRIDPARIVVYNVPLPRCGRRFRDVILNDGAVNGTRKSNGVEVPVFDELEVWRQSLYSTYSAELEYRSRSALETLVNLCNEHELGVEDWSSIRFICTECSRGNPGPHDCKDLSDSVAGRAFGFAAVSRSDLADVLESWVSSCRGAKFENLRVELPAESA